MDPSPEVIDDTTLVCTTPPGGDSACAGVPLEIAVAGVPMAVTRGLISTQNQVPLIQRASTTILKVVPRSAALRLVLRKHSSVSGAIACKASRVLGFLNITGYVRLWYALFYMRYDMCCGCYCKQTLRLRGKRHKI